LKGLRSFCESWLHRDIFPLTLVLLYSDVIKWSIIKKSLPVSHDEFSWLRFITLLIIIVLVWQFLPSSVNKQPVVNIPVKGTVLRINLNIDGSQYLTRLQGVELSTTLSTLGLSLSTRNRVTLTQLKDGVIVLKLNSKNLSSMGFLFFGGLTWLLFFFLWKVWGGCQERRPSNRQSFPWGSSWGVYRF
jgi:hypothetical protein